MLLRTFKWKINLNFFQAFEELWRRRTKELLSPGRQKWLIVAKHWLLANLLRDTPHILPTEFQSMHFFNYVASPNWWITREQRKSHYECDVWLLQNAVVRGTLLGLQYMGKDKGGKGGVVVNISSIAGLAPLAGCPVYVATKHAVIGLTRSFGVSTACSNMDILY